MIAILLGVKWYLIVHCDYLSVLSYAYDVLAFTVIIICLFLKVLTSDKSTYGWKDASLRDGSQRKKQLPVPSHTFGAVSSC